MLVGSFSMNSEFGWTQALLQAQIVLQRCTTDRIAKIPFFFFTPYINQTTVYVVSVMMGMPCRELPIEDFDRGWRYGTRETPS